jgi:hypothetical protein
LGFISGKNDLGIINKLKTPAIPVITISALAQIGNLIK